jgi:hypothetical protein
MERQQTLHTSEKVLAHRYHLGVVPQGLYHNLSQRTQLIYCDNLTNLILFLFLNLRE